MDLTSRIGRGFQFSALDRLVTASLYFVLLPFIVRHVGREAYGSYAIVLGVVGYFGLLDLGLSSAVPKYVAEYYGRSDVSGLSRVVSTAFCVYLIGGVLMAAGLFVVSTQTDLLFRGLDPAGHRAIRNLLLIAAVSAPVLWPTTLASGVAMGLLRYDVTAVINVVAQCVIAGVTWFLLNSGAGVTALLSLTVITQVVSNLIIYAVIARQLPGFAVRVASFDAPLMRTLFRYSGFVFLGQIGGLVIFQLDNLVVGVFVSVTAVTTYEVASRLQSGVRLIAAGLGGPVTAVSSELASQGNLQRERTLFFRGTRFVACVLLPIVTVLIVFARPLIRFWMGEGFEASVLPAQILIAFWYVNAMTNVGSSILYGKGIVRPQLVMSWTNACANLVLSLLLVGQIGMVGVAVGTTLPMMVCTGALLGIVLRTLSVSVADFFRSILLPAGELVIATLIVALLLRTALVPQTLLEVLAQMGATVGAVSVLSYMRLDQEGRRLLHALSGSSWLRVSSEKGRS